MFVSSSSSSKVTYVSALSDVLDHCELSDETREKLEALKSSLVKRSAHHSTKETKAQREAREFRENTYSALLGCEEAMTASAVADLMGCSVQKASAALRVLVSDGKVAKSIEKGKPFFKVSEAAID